MTITVFDSLLFGDLFGDEATTGLYSAEAEIAAMIEVEAALARAEGELDVIPRDEGLALAGELERVIIDPIEIASGAATAGVPVPALVAELRQRIEPNLARWLHWGATSQDIIDTGFMLRAMRALKGIECRVSVVGDHLAVLAENHRHTAMVGRTWYQHAIPIKFGLKAATWLGPLARARARLVQMRPRVFAIQFGGACGDLSALGAHGIPVMELMASRLGLAPSEPWHSQRDRIEELAGWLTTLTGAFGKMGRDIALLAQTEVGEIRLGSAGGSSTMPQKQNPIRPETLVSLANFNAGQVSIIHQGAVHGHERDGAAWLTEWLVLPQMFAATGGAARIAADLLATLTPNMESMAANLEASRGLVFAEAASFVLAEKMGRAESQALVERAARLVSDNDRNLLDVLAETTNGAINREVIEQATAQGGTSDQIIDRILDHWRSTADAT